MSPLPKDHVRGICVKCGKPTGRHWRAMYCWEHQAKAHDENEVRAIKKRKERLHENIAAQRNK